MMMMTTTHHATEQTITLSGVTDTAFVAQGSISQYDRVVLSDGVEFIASSIVTPTGDEPGRWAVGMTTTGAPTGSRGVAYFPQAVQS